MPTSPPPPYNNNQTGKSGEFTRYDTRTSDTTPSPSIPMSAALVTSTGLTIPITDPPGHQSATVAALIAASIASTSPILCQCPHCGRVVTTRCVPQTGCATWLCCWALAWAGCLFGCCLMPFCSETFRDVRHECPECDHTVAVYRRI